MSEYGDPASDPKAAREQDEAMFWKLLARVDNLVVFTEFEARARSVVLPVLAEAVVEGTPGGPEFVARGIDNCEAYLDLVASGGLGDLL